MKTFKTTLLTIVVLLCSISASAYDFEVDGIYYNITSNENLEVEVTHGNSNSYVGEIIIPETVEYNGKTYSVMSIGNEAFYNCYRLTSITIPNSVTSIGSGAFYQCSGLTSITIPNSVTSIGSGAFSETPWIEQQSDGVIYVNNVLYDYKGEMPANTSIEVREGSVSISASAFYGCSGLTNITIPSSVTSIGSGAFYECSGLTSITIPNSVTSIGDYAFYECSGLTSITIPNSVTSIAYQTFNGCSNLTSITIPNSVTGIDDAFRGCSNLTAVHITDLEAWCKIKFARNRDGSSSNPLSYAHNLYLNGEEVKDLIIPNSVTSIGSYAFYECSGLTSITIPNSVKSIGNSAFYGCSSLTSATIGSSVTNIGDYAFRGCSSLTAVHITDLEAWCKIEFAYDSNPLSYANHLYMNGKEVKDLIIPNSVTSIGNSAFRGCSGLTSITIPNSVTSIGSSAFSGCSGLTSATIGNSVTNIGESAFYECSGLTSFTIPNSVISIGDYAFAGCSGLTSATVGNSVTNIGNYAFRGCSNLTSITIGNSVTSIGEYAFYDCSGLTSITIPNSVTYIGISAFSGTSWEEQQSEGVIYANNVLYKYKGEMPANTSIEVREGTVCISVSAFRGCSGLTSITIPNSVMSIGNSAFRGCSGLTSITIPNSVTSIGDDAFAGCSGLTSITIPNSVISIGSSAFSGCSGLTSATVGNSVTSIGDYAFNGCSGLTSITIPNSVTSIGDYAFYECSGLTSITIGNSVTSIGNYAFYECSGLTSITIPNSVISIGDLAFFECSSLASATIGSSVTSVGNDAFTECTSLKNLRIEDGKETLMVGCEYNLDIGRFVGLFYSCPLEALYLGRNIRVSSSRKPPFQEKETLTSVTIGDSVTSIGNYAFRGCSNLKNLRIEDGKETLMVEENSFNTCPLEILHLGRDIGVVSENTDVSIFEDCKETLKSVTIGNTVTNIGANLFSGCLGLTSITIPNSVTSIGNRAFSGSSNLTSATIGSSVTSIGDNAFNGCSGLTSVIIPSSVTNIGADAFNGCSGLTSVIIPSSVTNIGADAFAYCSGLTAVHITDLDAWCKIKFDYILSFYPRSNPLFYAHHLYLNGKEVENIVISKSVGSIGYGVFAGCSGLTSITIPNSVKSIGDYAFYECINLKDIINCSELDIKKGEHFHGYVAYYAENVTTPDGQIGDYCFRIEDKGAQLFCYLGNDTDLILPENYSYTIAPKTFAGLSNIKSVSISNSVTGIGDDAFNGCLGLTNVVIGNSVTSIGKNAFRNCPNLTNISIKDDNPTYDSRNNCNAIIETGSNTLIQGCQSTIIPNSVVNIGAYAFLNCANLTNITIPNSVMNIENCAFDGCTSLKNMEIEDGKEALKVGHTYYSSLGGPGPIFSGCPLETLYLGRNIGVIFQSPFRGNKTLTYVTIGNSVTSVGDYAFNGCSSLTNITIPNSVTSIGNEVFKDCSNLTDIYLSEALTSIGDNLLVNCPALSSITLGATTPPTSGELGLITKQYFTVKLRVPEGSLAMYQYANEWKKFFDIEEYDPTGLEKTTIDTENESLPIYNLQGVKMTGSKEYLPAGIYIQGGKKILVR